MKDNKEFSQMVGHLSNAVEKNRVIEARRAARKATRKKILGAVSLGLAGGLLGVVYYYRVPISDASTKFFSSEESEYKSILKLSENGTADKSGTNNPPIDPNSRKAKLKKAMQAAQEHTALADDVINYDPKAKKP